MNIDEIRRAQRYAARYGVQRGGVMQRSAVASTGIPPRHAKAIAKRKRRSGLVTKRSSWPAVVVIYDPTTGSAQVVAPKGQGADSERRPPKTGL